MFQFLSPQTQRATVQPRQISPFRWNHADLRNAFPQNPLQMPLVLRDIVNGRIQPLLSVVIGGNEGLYTEDIVQPGLGGQHFAVEPFPQPPVFQDYRSHAQPSQIEALVRGITDHGSF